MFCLRHTLALLCCLACLAPAGTSQAQEPQDDETWLLTWEPAFTTPLTDPQRHQYGSGASLGVGVYRSLTHWMLLGGRLRGSVLASDDPPRNPTFEDQPAGGLFTLSAALRFRMADRGDPRRGTGPWAEVAGGPGLTDSLVRAVIEAGVGWNFEAGPVGIGPALRYQHAFHDLAIDNGPLLPDDAHLLIAGVEVVLFDERPRPRRSLPAAGPPEPAAESEPCANEPEDIDGFEDDDGCPDPDNDQDTILDVDDTCPNEPETFNGINDHDGCPDSGEVEVIDDRVVIEEEVFFEFDESDVKPSGFELIRDIISLWSEHPAWVGIVVEGHADNRGTREYNQALSERRADSVKDALTAEGMRRARIATEAYGEMQPRVHQAETAAQHARNRRVEFVVVRAAPRERVEGRPAPEVMEEVLEEDQ